MLQKYTPLIILILFAIGAYFMIQGMEHAAALGHPGK